MQNVGYLMMPLIVIIIYDGVEAEKKNFHSSDKNIPMCDYLTYFLSLPAVSAFRLQNCLKLSINASYRATLQDLLRLDDPCHEKTNVLVSDQVRHKPGCKATEDG